MGRTNTSGAKGLSLVLVTEAERKACAALPTKQARDAYKKKHGRWRIDLRWREPGTGELRRHCELFDADVKAATAQTRAREVLNNALKGGWQPRKENPKTLGEALDEYLVWAETNRPGSYQSRVSLVGILKAHFGEDKALDEITAFAVERFKRDRLAELAKKAGVDLKKPRVEGEPEPGMQFAATVNRAVAMLKHMVGPKWHALKEGWISKETSDAIRGVALLKEPPGRVRFLTADEASRLSAALAEDRQAPVRRIVTTVMLTGLRMGEVVGLRKEQVDLEHRQINLGYTKNGKRRTVPINEALVSILQEALEESPDKCSTVFVNTRGKPITKRGLHAVYFRAVHRAEIKDLDFHDLRHHAATAMRRSGTGLDVIARILGHTSLAMTQRYAHLSDAQAAEAVANLQPLPPAPPKTKEKKGSEPKRAAAAG